jgi:hypothetical protein
VLSDRIGPNDRVTVDALEGELHFDVETGTAAESDEREHEREIGAEAARR